MKPLKSKFSNFGLQGAVPLLTIAIPTYNRSNFLELCLMRLREELNSLPQGQCASVTVYISNNASTDNTEEIISAYQEFFPADLIIVKNEENIGGDLNIAQCYIAARTPYVWILGDDDVILPGGLSKILALLVPRDFDILYLNGYSYTDDYLAAPERGRDRSGVVEFYDSLDFVRHTHVMLTFITALVVRTGVDLAPVKVITAGSHLLQLGWALQLVRDGKKFAIVKDRIYAAKIANSGGYGAIDVFGRSQSFIVDSILGCKPTLAKAIQNGTIVVWFPTYIMNVRNARTGQSKNVYLKEDIDDEIRGVFRSNWRYYFFLLPLIKLPTSLAKPYFLLVRIVRSLAGRMFI